jgi:hypothetical protein
VAEADAMTDFVGQKGSDGGTRIGRADDIQIHLYAVVRITSNWAASLHKIAAAG